jgi:hypothetical protein
MIPSSGLNFFRAESESSTEPHSNYTIFRPRVDLRMLFEVGGNQVLFLS